MNPVKDKNWAFYSKKKKQELLEKHKPGQRPKKTKRECERIALIRSRHIRLQEIKEEEEFYG